MTRVAAAITLIALVGCTSSTYTVTDADGTTRSIELHRALADTEIGELTAERKPDGSERIEVKGLTTDLSKALDTLNRAIERLAPAPSP